jgi:predicted nucleic acid-binding protein
MDKTKFLFDTCSSIDLLNGSLGKLPDLTGMERYASVITRIELLSYPALTTEEEKRRQEFLSKVTVVPLDQKIENITVKIRRTKSLKLPDSIIAATAVAIGAVIITSDPHLHNLKWPGLQVINAL